MTAARATSMLPGITIPGAKSLTESVCDSDERARRLERLMSAHMDIVARVLYRLGIPQGDLEDATQKVFVAANRRLDEIVVGRERAYLLGIASRVALHERRTLFRRERVKAAYAHAAPWATSGDRSFDKLQARQMLLRVLSEMPVIFREVFVLYELEQLSLTEISHSLSIPRGTVASRLQRARTRFKKQLLRLEHELENA